MKSFTKFVMFKRVFMACLALSVATTATAEVSYGGFSDTPPGTVSYTDVSESSVTDPGPLYGTPDISGNLLDFDPASFGAFAVSGGADITDGQLNFTVTAEEGHSIRTVNIEEGGDFSFTGLTPTADTFVAARLVTLITILEIDGVALLNPIGLPRTEMFFDDHLNVVRLQGSGAAPDAGFWFLGDSIELEAVRLGDFDLGVTKIEVAIDNQLVAFADTGAIAFIAKKDFSIDIVTGGGTQTPEPTSLALLGLGSLLMVRRRRSR